MDLHEFYKTLSLKDLKSLVMNRGYRGSLSTYTRQELINAILFSDKGAAEEQKRHKKLPGYTLVLCHGRAHQRLLNIDYNKAVFIDQDPIALPDIVANYNNYIPDQLYDNMIFVHCPVPRIEELNVVNYLKPGGKLFILNYVQYDMISAIEKYHDLTYIGTKIFDDFSIGDENPEEYLMFVNEQ